MEQPTEYVAQGESSCVSLLWKAIYGLKQSPRTWFQKFTMLQTEYCFLSSTTDPTLWRKVTPMACAVLAIYVDDILQMRSKAMGIEATKIFLSQHIVTRDH